MELGPVESTSVRTPNSARPRSARSFDVAARPGDGSAADGSRLSMVVQMIERITGRKVKLVPPSAYFVSAPPSPVPERSNVEVALAAAVSSERGPTREPLIVDVSAVLLRGTSDRMIVGTGDDGGLAVFSGVNVEL